MSINLWLYVALMIAGIIAAAFCWFRINYRDHEDDDSDIPRQFQDHYLPTKDRHDG